MVAIAGRQAAVTLPPLLGHDDARRALAAAHGAGQLPSSLLLHGPPGVGKQRTALWLAQLQLCTAAAAAEPCGQCQACRMVDRLEHPDLHWFFPLPRPKGVGVDRMGDALEEARAAELAARRADPLRPTVADGLAGLYLAHVHVLLRTAAARPAMGSRKFFIIGDAEALVPQESSPEAANALLKLLEEPPADTTLVLTAAEPDVLLPTIRSRLLTLRLRPLADDDVARYLVQHAGLDAAAAARAARLGQGAIGRALAFARRDGQDAPLEQIRIAARDLLGAALQADPGTRLAAALAASPAGARGTFSDTLEFLTVWLRDLAAAATGAEEVLVNADSAAWLRAAAAGHPAAAAGVPAAIHEVQQTIQLTQLNINPQLALAGLLRRIRRHLVPQIPA
jgi:DNA polymerase III subunit delta'